MYTLLRKKKSEDYSSLLMSEALFKDTYPLTNLKLLEVWTEFERIFVNKVPEILNNVNNVEQWNMYVKYFRNQVAIVIEKSEYARRKKSAGEIN